MERIFNKTGLEVQKIENITAGNVYFVSFVMIYLKTSGRGFHKSKKTKENKDGRENSKIGKFSANVLRGCDGSCWSGEDLYHEQVRQRPLPLELRSYNGGHSHL